MATTASSRSSRKPRGGGFLKFIELKPEANRMPLEYPFTIPAVRRLGRLPLHAAVTFLVGENGTGKSTLVEAVAVCCGFNAEGGSRNIRFSTQSSESELHAHLQVVRGYQRERTGFFLRAESVFNVATFIDKHDADPESGGRIIDAYGSVSLHEQSHGESFFAIANNRFGDNGLYILDEPEAALSPLRQIAFLKLMKRLVDNGCQFLIATHSPVLLAFPYAWIYRLDEKGIRRVAYEETDHYRITRDFLNDRDAYLKHLFK